MRRLRVGVLLLVWLLATGALACTDKNGWPKRFVKGWLEQCTASGMEADVCDCTLKETRKRIPWSEMKPFMEKATANTPSSVADVTALNAEVAEKMTEAARACNPTAPSAPSP